MSCPYPLASNNRTMKSRLPLPWWMLAAAALVLAAAPAVAQEPLTQLVAATHPKVVKIYGAGGFRGLEHYQSGILVSPEGHVLTTWSYVLDTDHLLVHLADGRRLEAKLLGADPRLEMALLKLEGNDFPYFPLEPIRLDAGAKVLALSNLYGVAVFDEPVSVQHGVVAARVPLRARRGTFETPYRGPVYILDAIVNNPGAAGGAVIDRQGRLVGMIGKELRNTLTNTWINYAIPIDQLIGTIEQIKQGKFVPRSEEQQQARRPEDPVTLQRLGIVLVPDVLPKTPPFVEEVRPGSPADRAGLLPDDLILFVNGRHLVQSCEALRKELGYIPWGDPVRLTVIRGQELRELELKTR